MGQGAAAAATTGYYNIGIGNAALYDLTSGQNNIAIGANAGRNGSGSLGNISSNSNEIQMGNTSHTAAYIQIGWTTVSDARDKTKIKELDKGLEFIEKLKPVSYEFKKERQSEEADGIERYGFLAQDVLPHIPEVVMYDETEDKYGIMYGDITAHLVGAVKELKAEIDALKNVSHSHS